PAVSRGPLTIAAGVRDIGAVLDREGRRASGGVPARGLWLPALFGNAVRDAKNACGTPRCARAIHPRIRGRLEKLSRESGARECVDQAGQSADERRVARVRLAQAQ